MDADKRIANIVDQVIFVNIEDWANNFWRNKYLITIGAIGTQYYAVNADNEEEALDFVIDYIVEHYPGLVMDYEEEVAEEYLDEFARGGNEGRYLNIPNDELRIEKI